MKKIMQFRYYGAGDPKNYPSELTTDDWIFNILRNYGAVSHLGIQGEPGTTFYLNYGSDEIAIGETGIYELDLNGIGRITGLRFNKNKLNELYTTTPGDHHRIIVDIVYEGG